MDINEHNKKASYAILESFFRRYKIQSEELRDKITQKFLEAVDCNESELKTYILNAANQNRHLFEEAKKHHRPEYVLNLKVDNSLIRQSIENAKDRHEDWSSELTEKNREKAADEKGYLKNIVENVADNFAISEDDLEEYCLRDMFDVVSPYGENNRFIPTEITGQFYDLDAEEYFKV